MANNAGKIIKRSGTWLLRIVGLLLLIFLIVGALLQTQWGKNIVKNEAVKYLSKKLNTHISIGELSIEWFTHIRLNNVYLEDQQKRNLLSVKELDIQYDISRVLDKAILIKDIVIKDVAINLFRNREDSLFNFSFIPAAFTDTSSPTTTENATSFKLSLGNISLSKLKFAMEDEYGGQGYQFSLHSFKTQIDSFDLEKLSIHAKYLYTDSINCAVTFTQPHQRQVAVKPEPSESPASLLIGLDTVHIARTFFNLEDKVSLLRVNTNASVLAGSRIFYNMQKMHVAVGFANLLDHTTLVKIDSRAAGSEPQLPEKPGAGKPFTFSVKAISLDRNNIKFDDEGAPEVGKNQMNFGHLAFNNIQVNAANTGYNGNEYVSEIEQFKLQEKSGFQLRELKTKARYSDSGISLSGLSISTTQNQLEGNVEIAYKSIDQITKQPGNTKINAAIVKSTLQLDELLYFQPGLSKNASFRPLLGKKFYLNSTVKGSLDKLNIPVLSLKEGQTRLLANARIFNLPDIGQLLIDLKLQEFSSSKKELLSFLPPYTIADSLQHYLPQKFTLKGSYKGTINDLYTDVQLNTTEGNVNLKGTLKNISDKKNASYDIIAGASNLRLGNLMQDSMIGNVSATMKLKGKGYDIATANAVYDAKVAEATYNGYTYHDINAAGNINQNKLELHLQSNDPNIAISSDTWYDMGKSRGSFRTQTDIAKINLLKLGFGKDTLVISGKLNADIPLLDTAQLSGNLLATALNIQYANRKVIIDSVAINATYLSDTQTIRLTAPFADMTLKGKYSIQALPAAATTIANRYLYTKSRDTMYTEAVTASLQANVHIPDSMLFLVPGLKSISPFLAQAELNTDSSSLGFLTKINNIRYNDFEIDSLVIAGLNMPSNEKYKEMMYVLKLNSISSPSINLAQTAVMGNVRHGAISGKLALMDDAGKPRYTVPYNIVNDPVKPYLRIGDSLMINKKYWNVNKDNIIYLDMDSLKGSNLVISSQSESVRIKADSTYFSGMPLKINLSQFKLKNIADIMISDTTLVEGLANGVVSIQSLNPFSFTSNLLIDSLRLKEVNAGNLRVLVNQQTDSSLVAAITLKGMDNDVSLGGTYDATEKKVALKLDMQQFDLQNIEPFAAAYLGKVRGKLKGGLTINGTLDQPVVRGVIKTDSVLAVYKAYGTSLMLPAEEIVFDESGVKFNEIIFLDSAGNKGSLRGNLITTNYQDYKVDLKINTKNYLVIDKKKFPDQKIYGPTYADALINIGGSLDKLAIDGSVKIIDKSAFTYIYSASEIGGRGEGLIEFFDPERPLDSLLVNKKKKNTSTGTQIALNIYLDVTPESAVTIVLDELSGDQLNIKGKAALNFTMSPGGQMSMTGNYVVENGDYDLSIAQLIRKKFTIQKGSTITWSGDPLNAEMDITALYNVKTSAGELVNDIQSIPGIDKQKLNFEVYLLLTKQLLKPDIQFKLDMPENEQSVFNGAIYTRLKQVNSIPSELNKQVMGLLAINHFIADNPFSSLASGGGGSLETTAYATAGKLLTQELSDLVDNAIKGVDIDIALDMNEDYTSGKAERNTDLKVGLSKSLADNRLSVYVGSSFALEGENQNTDALEGLAGNVTLEYLLTKDGKYRIKGFRVTENELSLQGTVIKTGVTFVVVLEFNRLKNAFKNKKYKKA